MQQPPIFRLGIVMAGAVSAGAYTAGVMDYLFETLELWEQKKRINRQILADCGDDWEKARQNPDFDPSVPMHQVVLEAIAGASAGGMTAGITALSMFEGFHFYDENSDNKQNRLYHSWVNLNDEAGKPTFEQMLETTDIDEDGTVSSILNSKPIDIIADRLDSIQVNRQLADLGYVSPNLNLILTLCSLRGIPIDINFNTRTVEAPSKEEVTARKVVVPKQEIPKTAPAHRMFLHKGVGQFAFVNGQPKPDEDYVLQIDPTVKEHRKMLIEVAKATGAFPVGLKHRVLEMPDGKYVQAQVRRLFGMERQDRFNVAVDADKPFRFVAVDGGAINNEPIGEVDNILEDLFDQDCKNGIANEYHKNFGIIMIDPFPDFDTTEEVEEKESLTTIPFKLFGALRSQAMLKEGDIRRGFRGVDYTRGLVFPSKKNAKTGEPKKFAIACASLDGFGGFLSREFRHHDFLLGRRNCQSFIRKFFTVPETSPVLGQWTEEMKERCGIQYEGDDRLYFPIIPDLRGWGIENDPTALQPPPDVSITAAEVCQFFPHLRNRTERIIRQYFNPPAMVYGKKKADSVAEKPEKAVKSQAINRMINRHTGGLFSDVKDWGSMLLVFLLLLPLVPILIFLIVIPVLYWLLTKLVAAYVARQQVLKTILMDLKEKDLLKG
ncbi:MAG: hypothetical protein IT258_23645 [Saprospiraceae bacterium]|nr:hypothetical protein [Saprospiraceae bacterium]